MEVALFWDRIPNIDLPLHEDIVSVVQGDPFSFIVIFSPSLVPSSVYAHLRSFILKHLNQLYDLTVPELFRLLSVRLEALSVRLEAVELCFLNGDSVAFCGGVKKERLRPYLYIPNTINRAKLLFPDGTCVFYSVNRPFRFSIVGDLDSFLTLMSMGIRRTPCSN